MQDYDRWGRLSRKRSKRLLECGGWGYGVWAVEMSLGLVSVCCLRGDGLCGVGEGGLHCSGSIQITQDRESRIRKSCSCSTSNGRFELDMILRVLMDYYVPTYV